MRVSQVGREAATAYRAENFVRVPKDNFCERNARTPECLDRFFDAFAQLSQQGKKTILLMSLRLVVSSPFLSVGLLDRDRLSESLSLSFFVKGKFALGHDLNRVKMLAPELSGCEIRTSAMWLSGIGFDRVGIRATLGLRRDKPSVTVIASLKFCFGGNH